MNKDARELFEDTFADLTHNDIGRQDLEENSSDD